MATPIDREQLPTSGDDAVLCWCFNEYRALNTHVIDRPVEPVWATQTVRYRVDTDGTRSSVGSRNTCPVYATRAEALEACITAVKEWCDKRIRDLKEEAEREVE